MILIVMIDNKEVKLELKQFSELRDSNLLRSKFVLAGLDEIDASDEIIAIHRGNYRWETPTDNKVLVSSC
jgi:hypothetical protein